MAIEEPKTLLQAKASPHLKNCFIMFFQSPSVPVLVRWRAFKHFIIGPYGKNV